MDSQLEDIALPSDSLPESTRLGKLPDAAFGRGADADEAFSLFLEYEEACGVRLWPHQEDACMALALGDHVILGTPTGSGKSTVALWLAFLALCTGQRMYYTAPIKALVSEKFFDFVGRLGRDKVGMVTGDVSINASAPVICCTAEILANEALRYGDGANVAYAALDEFHFFGDRERGWAWQVPLLTLPYTQFLLMSATLGDTSAIAAKLEEKTRRPLTLVADAPRPVPLEYLFAADTALEGTVELALRRGEAPLYIVHFSQDEALKSAQSLSSFGISSKEQRAAVKEALAGGRFTTAFGKTLKRLLLMGMGVHHAGMLPRYRRTVEQLAQQGLLPVICGTDTLGMGINVPIRTVLLTALAKYDGTRVRRLNAREFHQIAGRAGRERGDAGGEDWFVLGEVPEGFALDQPLSPFLLASLELLDRASDTYALDVISLVEATLEQPRQVLRAQEREARSAAVAAMKADGVDYEERMERLEEITYPKPLEDLLSDAFAAYCKAMPWALDYELAPKSVLRDMVETASDFKTYVQRYGLARCEGILLRYLSDAYHVLDRTVPPEFYDERLDDVVCWLGWLVRSIDSSLFDEWAGNDDEGPADAAAPGAEDAVVADRRAVTLLVRNALFARVRLAAAGKLEQLGAIDAEWGWTEARWQEALDGFYAEHAEIIVDAHARSAAYLDIDESPESAQHRWHVRQIFLDSEGDLDFRIEADLDLDATQEEGEAVFANYRVGFVEDLA